MHENELKLIQMAYNIIMTEYEKEIFDNVASIYGTTIDDIVYGHATRDNVDARKMVSYHFKVVKSYSYPRIAKILKKHHTAIVYYVRKFEHHIKYENISRDKLDQLKYSSFTSMAYRPKNSSYPKFISKSVSDVGKGIA